MYCKVRQPSVKRKRNRPLTRPIPVSLAGAEGLDSRANCALGLPRSRTSTGSPLCTVSPSSPPTHAQNNKRAEAYATTLSLFWQGQKDLNPRPMVLETSTLPTELYPYKRKYYTKLYCICQDVSEKYFNICLNLSHLRFSPRSA